MTRWEYKIWAPGVRASLSDERLQADLNELGADGWELAEVVGNGESYVFKRAPED
jgi:hypothetical protein